MDVDRGTSPQKTKELVSFCERYAALSSEGASAGYFYKVQIDDHHWKSFWHRYHNLQWQQYEAFLGGRLSAEIFEPWLRQRRIDWNKGVWRIRSVALQLRHANLSGEKWFAVDASRELLVDVANESLPVQCDRAIASIEAITKLDSSRVGSRVVVLGQQDQTDESFCQYMMEESSACIRERQAYSELELILRDLFDAVAGGGKQRLEKSIQMSLDEQKSYREGWGSVVSESANFMKSFIVDLRAIMMSETDGRIRVVLDTPLE